jgi:ferredoxin
MIPDIDLSTCVRCLGCLEVCPKIFSLNPAGYIEIKEQENYPVECIDEAIRICPKSCLGWAEGN